MKLLATASLLGGVWRNPWNGLYKYDGSVLAPSAGLGFSGGEADEIGECDPRFGSPQPLGRDGESALRAGGERFMHGADAFDQDRPLALSCLSAVEALYERRPALADLVQRRDLSSCERMVVERSP